VVPQHQFLQKTNPHRLLPSFSSHHPQVVKEGVLFSLFHRAPTVVQGVNMVAGEEHLRGILEGMGYLDTFVKTVSKPYTAAEPTEVPKAKDIYSLCGRTDLGHWTGVCLW